MEKPIFIVGMPRSGTSLLGYILSSHSNVAIAPETHFFTKFLKNFSRAKNSESHAALIKLIDDYLNSAEIKDLGLTEYEKSRIIDNALIKGFGAKNIFEAMLRMYAQKTRKLIWGEKTPAHIEYVKLINDWFPGAKFIAIIRDPRDVSLSLQKVPWDRNNALQHARRWRNYIRLCDNYRDDRSISSKYIEIKYEELIQNTELIIKDICSFLNIPFEKNMLFYYKYISDTLEFKHKPWKKKNKLQIDTTNYNKWLTQMKPLQIRAIEYIAYREMKNRGYILNTYRGTQQISKILSLAEKYYFIFNSAIKK